MQKICLTVVGFYLSILSAFSQSTPTDSAYQKRKLKVDEINLVSGYYHQEGSHAAVTGGTGSEKLTDIPNVFDIQLSRYDVKNRKHVFTGEIGIDHYTSASSDKIDPHTISSASSADTRIYPSLNWAVQNEQKGSTVGVGVSFSNEFDYKSFGVNANVAKKSKDNNREVTFKAMAFLDQVSIILPIELRGYGQGEDDDYPTKSRNSFEGSLGLSQIVNERLQVLLSADAGYQTGFLSTPFHRVYFNDNSLRTENLPSSRLKIPASIRVNYFIGDKFIIRSFYRFYHDDWGLNAHTLNLEVPVKITPFISVSPYYRYYTQSAIKYFAPYGQQQPGAAFYSSDYDLSKFNSQFYGAGIRLAPPKGVFGLQHFNMLELRYGHYTRSTDLRSDIVSLNLRFK